MKERLAQFLRSEGLTAVKFAEIMEVQPSSISHLLSGRNKPNFEFVSRILLRFPNLNPDWIINGIGSIYKSNQTENYKGVTSVNNHEITKVNHDRINDSKEDFTRIEENDLFTQANDNIAVGMAESQVTNVNTEIPAAPAAAAVSKEEKEEDAAEQGIARVIVLFRDGSFEEYHEKKKNKR